jgi:hypothetical protein
VNFFHAGVDLLRSKSMDRDSFNSGDWFNRLDFTYQRNNWAAGLPVASKNAGEWPVMQPFLADPSIAPGAGDITATVEHMQEVLRIRDSSPLFALPTADAVQDRVAFHNTGPGQVPGLIVMSLADLADDDIDPRWDEIVVVFNANDEAQSFAVPATTGRNFRLHPVQQVSTDPVVRSATHSTATGAFEVGARTTAVFVIDETPPEASAALAPVKVNRSVGWFTVAAGCTDNGDDVTAEITLNGVPIGDGDEVQLVVTNGPDRHVVTPNRTIFRGRDFELVVTCTDGFGNTATTTATPEFA